MKPKIVYLKLEGDVLLIKKKMEKLGFIVEPWSSYYGGNCGRNYEDAGWTYGIRIQR